MPPPILLHLETWQALKESLACAITNHCSSIKHLHQLHSKAIISGLSSNLFLSSLLITKYFSFGSADAARVVFDGRPKPTKILVWNSLIKGYLRIGSPRLALDAYNELVESPSEECDGPDKHTFHLAINACSELFEFDVGSRIGSVARSRGLESDLLVGTALVGMYSKAGDLERARRVFDEMSVRDVVSWNAMISGYSQAECLYEAMDLFKKMRLVYRIIPTEATIVSVISALGHLSMLDAGEVMHAYAIKTGFEGKLSVSNSLMAMYIDCGSLHAAMKIFEVMVLKDAVSWSTIIGGYTRHERYGEALQLFHWMISNTGTVPSRSILLNVLVACAESRSLREVQWIEEMYFNYDGNGLLLDAPLVTALIYMYAKCGKLDTSLKLLDEVDLVSKDVIAWNVVIKACLELRDVGKVLNFTLEMQRRGIKPNEVTYLKLLSAVSMIPLPRKGAETHCNIIKSAFEFERPIANCLIDMYAKCGSIGDSQKVFDAIQHKDVISWSVIIKAHALNSKADRALNLFDAMIESKTRPNHVTFLAVLSTCSHTGYVNRGKEVFRCMNEDYKLKPGIEHFTCMVDMFCRAKCFNDAYDLLQNETMTKMMHKNGGESVVLWSSLLNACRLYGNVEIGEAAAKQLFLLDSENAANYMMLADIYMSAGRREDAQSVLRFLEARGMERRPGCSWFEG